MNSAVVRIARTGVAAMSKKQQLGLLGIRSISTTCANYGPNTPADRTQSTAFIKKDFGEKKVRSGTSTAVSGSTNPLYYKPKPSPKTEMLNKGTANKRTINKFVSISPDFFKGLGRDKYPGFLAKDFKFFGKPALLYRWFTQRLVDRFDTLTSINEKKSMPTLPDGTKLEHRPVVIDGKLGVGKSAELLKLAVIAASKGSIVIYAQKTVPWINSSRPYGPSHDKDDNTFIQNVVTSELLRSILDLSRAALGKVPLGKEVVIGKLTLGATKTLADLVDAGVQTPLIAHPVLETLMDIAAAQTKVPVLIALDDVNTLWADTAYTDKEDKILPADRLRLLRTFLPFFECKRTLARGCVVGATSYADNIYMPSELQAKLNRSHSVKIVNKAVASDPNLVRKHNTLPFKVIRLNRLTPEETRKMLEFYHDTRIVSVPANDVVVAAKWMSTNGNPRLLFNSTMSYF